MLIEASSREHIGRMQFPVIKEREKVYGSVRELIRGTNRTVALILRDSSVKGPAFVLQFSQKKKIE